MAKTSKAFSIALGHERSGHFQEAVRAYEEIITLDPRHAGAWHRRGVVAAKACQYQVAIHSILESLAIQPENAEAHNDLGTALRDARKYEEAADHFRQALRLRPDFAKALDNLGTVLQRMGRFEEAIDCHRRALEIDANDAGTHDNLGVALQELGRYREAAESHRAALALYANDPQSHYNLGVALEEQGEIVEAVACYRRAVVLKPIFPEAHYNLGVIFEELRKLDDAESSYNRAIELRADYVEAHWNRSRVRLLRGDFERGWPEYEWRWKVLPTTRRPINTPMWDGRQLDGQTVLIQIEQGFGDTFQFIRYAPLVKARGAKVVVECQKNLINLVRTCPGIDKFAVLGEQLPPCDFYAPLLSLPGIFKTTLETIPAQIPYLHADDALRAQWAQRLEELRGLRVGVAWHGREGQGKYRHRDIPIERIAKFAELPSVSLVNLQKDEGLELRSAMSDPKNVYDPGSDIDTATGSFMDTAAIVTNLDLVITSDSVIAHLAGALGATVWVGLDFTSDWRWLLHRADSPWYPTMRLFRQHTPADWDGVVKEITTALRLLVVDRT
jgi:tetratricopeptide (TPR) repeat protein